MTVALLLLVVAFILLLLAAFGIGAPRLSLGWLGLALWLLAVGILPALS